MIGRPKQRTNDPPTEQQLFEAAGQVRADGEGLASLPDGAPLAARSLVAVTAPMAAEFTIEQLQSVFKENGITLRWVIEQYIEMAKDKECTANSRIQALDKILYWVRMGASLNPAVAAKLRKQFATQEVRPPSSRWSREMENHGLAVVR